MACIDYDPKKVIVEVGDRTMFSIDEVEVTRDNDAWENTSSTNGRTSHIHNPTTNGNVRVVIGQEGVDDWAYVRQLADSATNFDVRVLDESGTKDLAIAKDCHVQVQPPLNRTDGRVTYEANFPSCDVQFEPTESEPSPFSVGNTTSGQ